MPRFASRMTLVLPLLLCATVTNCTNQSDQSRIIGVQGDPRFSTPIPPDTPPGDCNTIPKPFYCKDHSSGSAGNPCPNGMCPTIRLGQSQRNAFNQALSRVIMSDSECNTLANYASHVLANDHVRYYNNDTWAYPDQQSSDFESMGPWNVQSDNGVMHIGSKTFGDELKLAKSIIHEAFHGYYNPPPGVDDEPGARAAENRCVM